MNMKATTRQVDSVTVVDVGGRITLGEASAQLRELIRNELARGNKRLLLNLADATYIDSSGVGELMSAYTAVSKQGGQLKLLNLTRKVHDLLQITKLLTVFDVYDDEAKASASFDQAVTA